MRVRVKLSISLTYEVGFQDGGTVDNYADAGVKSALEAAVRLTSTSAAPFWCGPVDTKVLEVTLIPPRIS